MILVDSNVLMYAASSEHPHKAPAVSFLNKVARGEVPAAIEAEVLQEIIHCYRSLNRWIEGRRVYSLARSIFPEVLAVTAEVMDRAKELVDAYASLSARDAIHAAVVNVYRLDGICTFDRDFDAIRDCRRVPL